MKTDAQIRQDILDALKWNPSTRDIAIAVAVKDGVARLSGNVSTVAQKYAADRAAARVTGVRALADDITIKLLSSHERSHTEIAPASANVLKWDTEAPDDTMQARV